MRCNARPPTLRVRQRVSNNSKSGVVAPEGSLSYEILETPLLDAHCDGAEIRNVLVCTGRDDDGGIDDDGLRPLLFKSSALLRTKAEPK